jgi:O-antigen ligase
MTEKKSIADVLFESLIPSLFRTAIIVGTIALSFHKTTSNIALAAASVIGLIIFLRERKFNWTIGLLPVVMFVLYAVSILYTGDKKQGFRLMELAVTWLFVPMIFAFGLQHLSATWRDRLLQIFSLAVLVLCIVCYLRIVINTGRYVPSQDAGEYTYYDPLSRYSFTEWIDFHPTYLSMYLLFVMVIVFEKLNVHLVWKTLIMLLIAFFLVILSSKNQLLIYFPLAGLLFWRSVPLAGLWKGLIVVMLLGVVLYLGLQSDQIRYRLKTEITSNSSERATFWSAGSDLFRKNPIIGTGAGDGQRAIDEWMIAHGRNDLLDYNLHNQFLDYLVSFGMFGLLAFLFILIIPLVKRVDFVFLVFILIVGASCMTEAILVRQKGLCFFVLMYGLLGTGYWIAPRR